MPDARSPTSAIPTDWGRDLPVNRGRYNFDEIRYEYFRDMSVQFEAFKSGVLDVRTEDDPKLWASGYDIPARRDGRVLTREIETGLPAGMSALAFIPAPDERIALIAFKPEKIYKQVNNIAPDLVVYFGNLDWRAVGSLGLGGVYTFENYAAPTTPITRSRARSFCTTLRKAAANGHRRRSWTLRRRCSTAWACPCRAT